MRAGLSVQPLKHALREADIDTHRNYVHVGRAEKLKQRWTGGVHCFVLKLLLRHGLHLLQRRGRGKLAAGLCVLLDSDGQGILSHDHAHASIVAPSEAISGKSGKRMA